ncbi:MAG: 3-methyl-2-oxobutanoate hydroxymethyltransferase [Phycisphaerales bacterium]
MNDTTLNQPVTLQTLRKWTAGGRKFAMLTCYDATTARWLASGGVPVLLVGDSAAQMILGRDSSIHAPLDFMLTITAAVKRGAARCFVMGDMPFMSYQADDAEAIRNAGRFLTEGLADAVKLEVDGSFAPLVAKMSRAGIPVVAHMGWRPQMARHEGVRTARIAGRTADEAHQLIADAKLMEQQGAVMLLLEAVPPEVSERIVNAAHVPVIGCGAGPACAGQVVVLQDLLGMTERQPSFAQPIAQMGRALQDAASQWVKIVEQGSPRACEGYRMNQGEAEKL